MMKSLTVVIIGIFLVKMVLGMEVVEEFQPSKKVNKKEQIPPNKFWYKTTAVTEGDGIFHFPEKKQSATIFEVPYEEELNIFCYNGLLLSCIKK
jgi:hypothetical protein